MPISTDTSTAFTSSTGYTAYETTPGDIVFSAGTATLTAGTVTAAVRTPVIDTSAFGPLLSAVATATEAAKFSFAFLVSFEDWSDPTVTPYFYAFLPTIGWYTVARYDEDTEELLERLFDRGLKLEDLGRVRDWPEINPLSRLSFLVGMKREASGGNGSITLITVSHGTEVAVVVPTLATLGDLPYEPNFPLNLEYEDQFDSLALSGGYEQTISLTTRLRKKGPLSFGPLEEADSDILLAFLISAMDRPFDWQPYGDPASRQWRVVGIPQKAQAGRSGLFSVNCSIAEYLAP